MSMQVFVPLMFGRTESEARDPTANLQSLSELATQLLSRPAAIAAAAAVEQTPRQDIYLVQGPAGCGKSLFAWHLYTRFGAAVDHD